MHATVPTTSAAYCDVLSRTGGRQQRAQLKESKGASDEASHAASNMLDSCVIACFMIKVFYVFLDKCEIAIDISAVAYRGVIRYMTQAEFK